MTAEASVACPRCGSTVRRGSDWCTLCFADLRPVPPPRVSADPIVVPAPASAALTAVLAGTVAGPAPINSIVATTAAGGPAATGSAAIACSACGEPVLLEVAVCGTCGAGLFDTLKQEDAQLVLPLVGDVMRFGKGARTGVALGFATLFVAVLFLLITILGRVV